MLRLLSQVLLSHTWELLSNIEVPVTSSTRNVVAVLLAWLDAFGEVDKGNLGGGMIGAVLLAATYFLFDVAGAKLFAILFMIIGVLLLTGKTLGDSLGKFFISLASFISGQWQGFTNDMKQWKKEAKEKKKNPAPRQRKIKEKPAEPKARPISRSASRTTYFKLYR